MSDLTVEFSITKYLKAKNVLLFPSRKHDHGFLTIKLLNNNMEHNLLFLTAYFSEDGEDGEDSIVRRIDAKDFLEHLKKLVEDIEENLEQDKGGIDKK